MKTNHRSLKASPGRDRRSTSTVTYETSYNKVYPQFNSTYSEEVDRFEMSPVSTAVLPKTDYTYVRSGSYSPRHLHDKYTTPNMSRRGLRKIVTPPVSLLHDSDSDSSIAENQMYERVVTRPGMTLRSGIRLTREERLLAEQEERRRKLSAGILTNSGDGTPVGALNHRHSWTHPTQESKEVTTVTTTKKYLVVEDSDDQKEDYSYSSAAGYGTRSQAKSGHWWSSQAEEGSRLEKERNQDECDGWISNQKEEGGVRLRHLYDVEDIDMKYRDGKEVSAESRGLVSSFFYFIMTVVTTTIEYTYTAADVVTAPVRTYLVNPVSRGVWEIITWIDQKVCTFISYFTILDAWILSRLTRNYCCLCLPLLLLLPLCCGGGYYLYQTEWKASAFRKVFSWRTRLFEKATVILPMEQDSGPRQWMTKSEIELLVQSMLDPQLESLQFSVLNIANEGSSHQTTLATNREESSARMASIEKQMAAFFSKTKEETVNILNLYNEMRPMVTKQDWLSRAQIEELVQSMLNLQMGSLRLDLLNVVKEGSNNEDVELRLKAMEEKLSGLKDSVLNTNLHQEVQQILVQLRKEEDRDWLTQSQVEALVKGLLTAQTESLRLSLMSSLKEGNAGQGDNLGVIQEEARLRLEIVEKQMAELRDRTQTTDLSERVQHILVQLQKDEKRNWLTESEIKVLLSDLLSPQLDSLRLSLLSIGEEGNKASQDALKVSQDGARLRLASVDEQLADLHSKAKDAGARLDAIERQLAGFVSQGKLSDGDLASLREQLMAAIYAVRDNMEEKLTAEKTKEREGWEAKLASMEVTLADLRTVVQTSQTSRSDIVALSEKCCKGDAALLAIIREEVGRMLAERQQQQGGAVGQVNTQEIEGLIGAALLKYSADKMDLPDYALESTGGSVVNIRCSQTYSKRAATVKVWGIPLYYTVNSPRTVIQIFHCVCVQPEVLPGNCWPFEGEQGSVVVQLAVPIRPTMFTLEHISKAQSIFGNNESAPKGFIVLGLSSESDTGGVILGEYQYDADGMPMQHFKVQMEEPGIFLFVELRVTSNHGHKEYTCLYRFRVHGLPQEHN
ncbi:hypothetical protein ACOMHN_034954 [Nucella lapillus]